jgi:acetyl-CoA acetyltransferase
MALYGSTAEDLAAVKVKNAKAGSLNPNARYRKAVSAEEVSASPMVADPLRLMDICATSDGGAAVVLVSDSFARRRGLSGVRVVAVSTVTPMFLHPADRLVLNDVDPDALQYALTHLPPATRAQTAAAPGNVLRTAAHLAADHGPFDLVSTSRPTSVPPRRREPSPDWTSPPMPLA